MYCGLLLWSPTTAGNHASPLADWKMMSRIKPHSLQAKALLSAGYQSARWHKSSVHVIRLSVVYSSMLYAKLVPPLNVARAMIVLGLTLVPNAAQQAPPATPVRFDVISIKPVTSPRNSSPTNIDHGSMTAENISIPRLIQAAFEVHDYQILNTPGWVDGARYDVLAKCDSATYLTGRQMAPMIQHLLKDRFDFRYHRETRDRHATG